MNARATSWIIAAIVTLLGLVLAAWWYVKYERVEVDVPAPLQGEAAYNSLYALQKVLVARGYGVTSHAYLNLRGLALGPYDTLVLGGDVRTLGSAQVDQLLDWLEGGGALLFGLPAGAPDRPGDLIEQLGLVLHDDIQCVRLRAAAAKAPGAKAERPGYCFASTFSLADAEADADAFEVLAGDGPEGYFLGRAAWGEGVWSALGDLDFLRNDQLDQDSNAELGWQVLAPLLRGGRVHLVYATEVPALHVLLVRHGWPVLLPVLLALLAWLWLRARRFGPLLPTPEAGRRALCEHIDAAGEFVFRNHKASALYAPLRRAFDMRLQREDPQLAALEGEELIAVLATRTGVPATRVRTALQPTDINDPNVFQTAVQFLAGWRLR